MFESLRISLANFILPPKKPKKGGGTDRFVAVRWYTPHAITVQIYDRHSTDDMVGWDKMEQRYPGQVVATSAERKMLSTEHEGL